MSLVTEDLFRDRGLQRHRERSREAAVIEDRRELLWAQSLTLLPPCALRAPAPSAAAAVLFLFSSGVLAGLRVSHVLGVPRVLRVPRVLAVLGTGGTGGTRSRERAGIRRERRGSVEKEVRLDLELGHSETGENAREGVDEVVCGDLAVVVVVEGLEGVWVVGCLGVWFLLKSELVRKAMLWLTRGSETVDLHCCLRVSGVAGWKTETI